MTVYDSRFVPVVRFSPSMVEVPSWAWAIVVFYALLCVVAVAVAFYAVGRESGRGSR